MSTFLLVVVIGVAIFIYSNMKSTHSQEIFDVCKPIINNWITEKNGVLETVMSATYNDDSLCVHKGSRIFVGQFDRKEGESCGFYLEVLNGEIALSKQFFPNGITSWHSSLAREAKLHGVTLFEMLNLSESNHHEKFPHWKDVS